MAPEDKRKIKVGICIAAFTVLFYVTLQNIGLVLNTARFLLRVLSPFLYGVCIAFVLNIPLRFFENRVFRKMGNSKKVFWRKARRPISVVIVLLLFLGLVAGLISIVIPQLDSSLQSLSLNVKQYITNLESAGDSFLSNLGITLNLAEFLTEMAGRFSEQMAAFVSESLPKLVDSATAVLILVTNLLIGFVVAVYMLLSKERLLRSIKAMIYAYIPQKAADYIAHIYHVSMDRLTGFVSGQLTESVILGALCYIGMSIFRMDYALLISLIVGITNVVPIVGPIVGAIPGALIMLMIHPMKMVWFVVYIIVLQQVEANFIYPKVVGSSIGLPGFWVLFAVLVGGSLFSLPGVLLGVPFFAVFYTLISESVKKRLRQRKVRLNKTTDGS